MFFVCKRFCEGLKAGAYYLFFSEDRGYCLFFHKPYLLQQYLLHASFTPPSEASFTPPSFCEGLKAGALYECVCVCDRERVFDMDDEVCFFVGKTKRISLGIPKRERRMSVCVRESACVREKVCV